MLSDEQARWIAVNAKLRSSKDFSTNPSRRVRSTPARSETAELLVEAFWVLYLLNHQAHAAT